MSDTDATQPETEEVTTTPETGESDGGTDWKAQARKWESRAKENRDTAEANAAAARELEEIKQAQMSDLEKAQQAAQESAERVAALEAERDRLQVIAKYGIPEDYAFLVDSGDLEVKAAAVQKLIREEQEAVEAQPLKSAGRPLPRSMSEVTVEDQLKDAAKRGDKQAEMRLKLMSLNKPN